MVTHPAFRADTVGWSRSVATLGQANCYHVLPQRVANRGSITSTRAAASIEGFYRLCCGPSKLLIFRCVSGSARTDPSAAASQPVVIGPVQHGLPGQVGRRYRAI